MMTYFLDRDILFNFNLRGGQPCLKLKVGDKKGRLACRCETGLLLRTVCKKGNDFCTI